MGLSGKQNLVGCNRPVEPVKEQPHFFVQPLSRRRLEVHPLPANRPRDDLHGAGAIIPPCAHPDPMQGTPPRGKQRGMPAEQPFHRQWLLIILSRVEHHLDDALDIPVGRCEPPEIQPQPAPIDDRT